MRTSVTFVVVAVIAWVFAACSSVSPTAPTTSQPSAVNNPPAPGTPSVGNLQLGAGPLNEAQDTVGNSQYTIKLAYRETGGVDLTINKIEAQLRNGSGDILGTASVTPVAPVLRAYSLGGEALLFLTNVHVKVTDIVLTVAVQFTDANGTAGTVSATYSCFGCWDY